jgi:hypothetical protein
VAGTDTYQGFIDGAVAGTLINTITKATVDPHDPLQIGRYNDPSSTMLLGWLDELRITKGSRRYTAAFTPPAAPFPGGAGASFIGVDTTRTTYPLSVGYGAAYASFAGWLDEISAVIGQAMYMANYTPEGAAFADPTAPIPGSPVGLVLDRALDWPGTAGPRAILLSNETNGVSVSIQVVRGEADHIAILLSAPPFALFGKDAHQEPTRIAFGQMGYEVRDWIVVVATPQAGQMVHVEALTYDPDVYEDAMPHQLVEP